MKTYAILEKHQVIPNGLTSQFLTKYASFDEAQAYVKAQVRKKQIKELPHLAESIRNDLCDRGAQMQGHFLEIVTSDSYTAMITLL